MTDQEQDHDAMHHANPSQAGSAFSETAAVQEREEAPEQHHAGIVAHRDQFNEPGESAEQPGVAPNGEFSEKMKSLMNSILKHSRRNPDPSTTPPAKPKLHTIFLAACYSIKTSPYGGVLLHGTTIFDKSVQIRVCEIKSIEPIASISDSSVELVSLKDAAERLFVTCDGTPFDLRDPENWFHYLEQVAFPVIENMAERWIGAGSPGISNPVTEFFFGQDGIIHFHQDRRSVLRRLQAIRSNSTIPLVTRYQGPALVLIYEK